MNLRFYGNVKDTETDRPIIGAIVKLYLNQKEIQKSETTKNGFYEIITQIDDESLQGGQKLRITFEKADYQMRENYIFATEGAYNMDVDLHKAEVPKPQPRPFKWLPVAIGVGAAIILLIGVVIALLIFFRPKAPKGYRIEARTDGIHFKTGDLANDSHIDIYANMAGFDILRLGDKWRFSGVGDAHGNDDWLRMFDVNNTGYYGGFAAGSLWSSSGTLSGSDISSKKEIKHLTGSLEKVMALNGVSFKWKDPAMPQTNQMG